MRKFSIPYEGTAEAMSKEQVDRFGKWILEEDITYTERLNRLQEVFKHINLDGIQTGQGLKELITRDSLTDTQAELAAEHAGYMKAINDIEEGQGEA